MDRRTIDNGQEDNGQEDIRQVTGQWTGQVSMDRMTMNRTLTMDRRTLTMDRTIDNGQDDRQWTGGRWQWAGQLTMDRTIDKT